MRVRGHGRKITRARVRGRTTAWRAGCKCGWEGEHFVGSRLEAIAQTDVHKSEMFAQGRGAVVRRAYPTTETS